MFGRYFTYNGHSSTEFNLMIGGFRTETDVPLAMNREVLKGSMNRFRTIPNHMGTSYTDVLIFTVSVVKDACNNNVTDYVFTEAEVNNIVAWITSPKYPTLFHMTDDEPEIFKTYDYFALCTDVQTQTNEEEVVGLTFTFTTNSPYAWTESKVVAIDNNVGSNTVNIAVNSAEKNAPIYPVVTIRPSNAASTGTDGRVVITLGNYRDNGSITMHLLKMNNIIDSQKAMIYSQTGSLLSFEDLGFSNGAIWWPKLYDGNNTISISGDCSVRIEYREPRKVGAY